MSESTKDWIVLYARVVMGGMFLITGVRKSFGMLGGGGFAGSTKFVASQMGVSTDVAQILLGLAVALEIIAGLMLIIGWRTRLASIGLIIFVLILTPIFHGPWLYELPRKLNELDQCLKNLNLIGAMLMFIAFGAGRFSLDAKAGRASWSPKPA